LDGAYSAEREKARRDAAGEVLLVRAGNAAKLPPADRAIWLAQIAAWIPQPSRAPVVEKAIEALLETVHMEPPSNLQGLVRAFQVLAPIADQKPLRDAATEVMQKLPTADAIWDFKLRVTNLLNIDLPPLGRLILDLPNDNRRLDALTRWRFEVPQPLLLRLIDSGLDAFTDRDSRAAGCAELVRRLDFGALGESSVTRVLGVVAEATDSVTANNLLNWLQIAAPESMRSQVFRAKVDWNSAVTSAEDRARGMFSAISLGLGNDENAELSHRGLAAAASVQDEAVRATLLRDFVCSIPGCPIWEQDVALAIADGIEDERLRAMAYSYTLVLGSVRDLTLEHGLGLTDEWARASIIFEWQGWAPPPLGLDAPQWGRMRRDAVYAVSASHPRARYLTILAAEATDAARRRFAHDAQDAANAIANPSGRAWAIHNLVNEGLIPREEQSAAVMAGWEIRAPVTRFRMLAMLSRILGVRELVLLLERLVDAVVEEADQVDFASLCEPPGLEFGFATDSWWEAD
jgi:hypothetical protein